MKALILAAGYGTRLYPLTKTIAKPLLPVGGRPMIDHIVAAISEVPEIDTIHVVTNRKFGPSFADWAGRAAGGTPIVVHDDGTTSEDDRLGAIGDIQFVVQRAEIADDLFVVAGDNLFDFSLPDYVEFWRGKGEATCIALYEEPDRELVKQYSTVELDEDSRVTSFVEKPEDPKTNLIATATYLFHHFHVALVQEYLDEGHDGDKSGSYVEWLHTRAPVYGYRFSGEWADIGNHEQLLEADNKLRARAGLPERPEYSPEATE